MGEEPIIPTRPGAPHPDGDSVLTMADHGGWLWRGWKFPSPSHRALLLPEYHDGIQFLVPTFRVYGCVCVFSLSLGVSPPSLPFSPFHTPLSRAIAAYYPGPRSGRRLLALGGILDSRRRRAKGGRSVQGTYTVQVLYIPTKYGLPCRVLCVSW